MLLLINFGPHILVVHGMQHWERNGRTKHIFVARMRQHYNVFHMSHTHLRKTTLHSSNHGNVPSRKWNHQGRLWDVSQPSSCKLSKSESSTQIKATNQNQERFPCMNLPMNIYVLQAYEPCNPEFQISRLSAGLQSPRLRTGKNCEQSWLVKCAGKKGLKINKYRNQMWFLQCINFLPPGTSTLLQAERCWAMPLKRDLCLLEKGIFCKHLPAECRSSTLQTKSAAVLMYDKAFLYDVFVDSCRAHESKCCISLTLSISTWCSRPTAAVWDLRFQARNETISHSWTWALSFHLKASKYWRT